MFTQHLSYDINLYLCFISVVIESCEEVKTPLDLETVLFIENGSKSIGQIDDVLGMVKSPYYCVRFNDLKHIKQYNLQVGQEIYYGPKTEHTKYVFLKQLLRYYYYYYLFIFILKNRSKIFQCLAFNNFTWVFNFSLAK